MSPKSQLNTPLTIRGVTIKNRIVISPMCNYSAHNGLVNDWHLVTVGRYAQGGAGLVFVEATAVQADGRITHGDTGLWHDGQIEGMARIVQFIKEQGATAAIQLGHAGRKASMARPWFGNGPLTQADTDRGDFYWQTKAPSAIPVASDWPPPVAMSIADIEQLRTDFKAAALRAMKAGFEVLEMHCAHGYLLHSFLSPLSNVRKDAYGGSIENRMRLVIEIATDLRALVPLTMPLFVRLSAVDDIDGGWSIEDSVQLAKALKTVGIDIIDCSSGGIMGSASGAASPIVPKTPRAPGFQVPWAAQIKREANIQTMAVGLILTPQLAADVIDSGDADLVAIAREALDNPNWPLNALRVLGLDAQYAHWPKQAGWWLNVREGILRKIGLRA
jgi:2,4-dienoyl-CoA reductase-like NADH-dependent reductase (Old Yellow Enzyme family)